MNISKEKEVDILNDHYKDTCERIRENVVLRDRLFLYVLLVIGLHFFQVSDRSKTSESLVSFLKEHSGFQITANVDVLTAVLWFLLLALVVRYFQANVYVNRQYNYLHQLEDQFKELLGHHLISREGKNYLSRYPHFSNWTHFLYTWFFPFMLLATIIFKIIFDGIECGKFSLPFLVSLISCLMIIISIILYMIFLHQKEQ